MDDIDMNMMQHLERALRQADRAWFEAESQLDMRMYYMVMKDIKHILSYAR